jgi:four helix bundle protein
MQSSSEKFKVVFKKRLYKFTLDLIEFIDHLPNDNASRRMGDQLLRCGTSIIANFIEGQSASSKKDLINYLNTSLKSSNESKLWLSLLKDTKRANNGTADKHLNELKEISNILASSILKLKDKK